MKLFMESATTADGNENRSIARQGLKLLLSELAIQIRHRKVLLGQTIALIACDRRSFVALQDVYVALLAELEIQNRARSEFFGAQTVEEAVATWPEVERRSALTAAAELKTVLQDIRRANVQNRTLIGSQMKYIDFMLDLLIKTHRKGATYGPEGLSSVNRGNMLLNQAA